MPVPIMRAVSQCILVLCLQIINLDLLDTIGASRGTEELKEEIKKQVGKNQWPPLSPRT